MTTTRRGILGALAGVPALALPAAAIACAPATLAASPAPSAASTTKEEAEGLIEVGRRMPDLLKEFWTASADLKAATTRFNETAPLPPKPRKRAKEAKARLFKRPLLKIVRAELAPRVPGEGLEVTPAQAYEGIFSSEKISFLSREVYHVSNQYVDKLLSAAQECGYSAAASRFRRAQGELSKTAEQAFTFKPETRRGVTAQALALSTAPSKLRMAA